MLGGADDLLAVLHPVARREGEGRDATVEDRLAVAPLSDTSVGRLYLRANCNQRP